MRENTTRALIAALVLLVSSAATSTEAAGKAVKRPCKTRSCRHHRLAVPPMYQEWANVAHCEENDDWEIPGGSYPDSLGINATNWVAAGGKPLAPTSYAPLRERYYEVKIANRFRAQYGDFAMPDQPYGNCTGSY